MGRKFARTTLMQCLYMIDVTGDSSSEILETFQRQHPLNAQDNCYFQKGVQFVTENQVKIDELIFQSIKGWSMSRLAKVDLAIMRVAVFEMLDMDDVPFEVSINEAVNLAKAYSTEDSYAFINGVLGGVVKYLDEQEGGA